MLPLVMRKLFLLTLLPFVVACQSDSSEPAAKDWSPVATMATCNALNTLPNGQSFEITSPDGVGYQFLNGSVSEVGVPGAHPGSFSWDRCQLDINNGNFVSATWQ